MAEEHLSEYDEYDEYEQRMADLAVSIGWHLAQGEALSASYGSQAQDERWTEFFRFVETEYAEALSRVGEKLGATVGRQKLRFRWRPPYK